MFHPNSHFGKLTRKPKVEYGHLHTAEKAARSMGEKWGGEFSAYKCVFCDGYHIGRNR